MGETGGRSKDVTCCFIRAKKDVLLQLVEDRLNSSAKMNANERSNHTEGQQNNNNKEKNKSAEVRSYTIDQRFSFERSCGSLEVMEYAPSAPSDLCGGTE